MIGDILIPAAAGLGAAVAAGMSAFRIGRILRSPSDATIYVRLSAEDSDRVEKIEALLDRVIGLEEQTQAAIDRLAEQVAQARLEHARREGFLHGRLDALRRLDE